LTSPARGDRAHNERHRRAATLSDVAQIAGVSKQTASNAVLHPYRLAPATRARVEDAIERVRFVPSSAARALRGSVSSLVLIAASDLRDPFIRGAVSSFDARMAAFGLLTQIFDRIVDDRQRHLFGERVAGASASVQIRCLGASAGVSFLAAWHHGAGLELIAPRPARPDPLDSFAAGETAGLRAAAALRSTARGSDWQNRSEATSG
jgi:hypothetical protein